MQEYFLLVIAAIFVNNIVLAQYLGNCPFVGTSKDSGVALGMGGAVVFVMVMAAAITWAVQKYLLEPMGLGYLQTLSFILVIASLVQFVEMFLKKAIPPLYKALGIFLPLITTNCAVLGVALLGQREAYDLPKTIAYAVAAGVGFLLALVVLAHIRMKLDTKRVPESLKGTPIGLIMAGLMSLAFFAFKGMI
jgi:electron transport complex protein RnfA